MKSLYVSCFCTTKFCLLFFLSWVHQFQFYLMWCSSFDHYCRLNYCIASSPLLLEFLDGLVIFYCPFQLHFPSYQHSISVFLYNNQFSHEFPFTFHWHSPCLSPYIWLLCLLQLFPRRMHSWYLFIMDYSLPTPCLWRCLILPRSLWPIDSHLHYLGLGAIKISGWWCFS